ncbi:MAG: MFS transporter, partial [Euryarchaeota archaeon]|nr:MFS transporter [Euryarchaeota archaeon]
MLPGSTGECHQLSWGRNVQRIGTGQLRVIVRDLWRDGRGWILLGVAGGWFLSLGLRLVFPALLPYLREAFSLGLTASGLLISVLWIAYALGQFPGGIIGDRLGEGNALVISTLVSGTMIAVVAVSNTSLTLFLATGLFGFSTALFGPARFTILSAIYEERDGTAIGLTLSAGEAGNAILPVVAGVLAAAVSWRLGFGAMVPLFGLMAVVLFRVVPGKLTDESAVDSLSMETLKYVARGITERSILIAGGIGITPILAMLRTLVASGADTEVHYAAAAPERMAYRDDVVQLAGDRALCYTGGRSSETGMDLRRVLGNPGPGAHVYVCGPRRMIEAVREIA